MNLRDLLVVHAVIGAACAVAVYRQSGRGGGSRIASALLAVPLWPLWAPFVLGRQGEPRSDDPVARIHRGLQTALAAAAGTPLERVLSRTVAARIADEVRATAARLRMIDDLGARANPAPSGATSEAPTAARLQADAHERLCEVRARHARSLAEVADLLEALTAQLALARLGEPSAEAAAETLAEIWARLQRPEGP